MIADAPAPAPLPIHIERGGGGDLDSIVAIMEESFDDRFGEAWTRSQCAGILPMPGVALSLARRADGTVAGFALYRIIACDAELLLLAVAPLQRRRGIATALLDHFIAAARAEGADKVHLEVRDGNPAVIMYRRAGFAAAGRRRKYYRGRTGGEYDAITLSRPLA